MSTDYDFACFTCKRTMPARKHGALGIKPLEYTKHLNEKEG